MTTKEKIEFTQRVFTKVAIDDQTRIKNGMALREEMHRAIARGEEPKGYRVEWAVRSVQRVIKTLEACAEELRTLHADDAASTLDFADILTTARRRLGLDE